MFYSVSEICDRMVLNNNSMLMNEYKNRLKSFLYCVGKHGLIVEWKRSPSLQDFFDMNRDVIKLDKLFLKNSKKLFEIIELYCDTWKKCASNLEREVLKSKIKKV